MFAHHLTIKAFVLFEGMYVWTWDIGAGLLVVEEDEKKQRWIWSWDMGTENPFMVACEQLLCVSEHFPF